MKELSLETMSDIEGGSWIDAVGCAAGITLVVASVGVNIFAFAAGVGAIDYYCGNVM